MYINIKKVIEDLEIKDKIAYIGTFSADLSVGKEAINQILNHIEEEELSAWEASDEIDELETNLRSALLKVLKKRDIEIRSVMICNNSFDEQYVKKYSVFFEWEVLSVLSTPLLDPLIEMYYNKEDVAWMRKLLNTPFNLPYKEKLEIYRKWQKYWEIRSTFLKQMKIKGVRFCKDDAKKSGKED